MEVSVSTPFLFLEIFFFLETHKSSMKVFFPSLRRERGKKNKEREKKLIREALKSAKAPFFPSIAGEKE